MKEKFRFLAVLLLGSALAFGPGCKSSNPSSSLSSNFSSNSPMDVTGNWTLTVTSTQGQGTVSATGDVAQSGQGLGTNGVTTLSANGIIGSITISQSGSNLTGTLSNPMKGVSYNFTGTLSGGNITITGSVACGMGVQTTTISGTVSSTKMHGDYTTTRDSGCYYPSDAGAWSATKQ
jgi:hypothetical protein